MREWGASTADRRRALSSLRPGTVISVRVAGVWHEGILSDRLDEDGAPRVLHKSKRTYRAEEETAAAFAPEGRQIRIVGFLGGRSSEMVVGAARSRIGEAWTVTDNCQRYTRRAHGVPARSPGLEAFAACVLLGFFGAS